MLLGTRGKVNGWGRCHMMTCELVFLTAAFLLIIYIQSLPNDLSHLEKRLGDPSYVPHSQSLGIVPLPVTWETTNRALFTKLALSYRIEANNEQTKDDTSDANR